MVKRTFFNLGKLKHLDLVDRWASTQSLQPHGCHGGFGCSTGALPDRPCWGSGFFNGRKLDQKSSYHSWWHMQKAWWEFLEDKLFWEIEVYLSSRFLPYFPLLASRWFEQISAGNCSAQDPAVNFTTSWGFLTLWGGKKRSPGMNLMFGYAFRSRKKNELPPPKKNVIWSWDIRFLVPVGRLPWTNQGRSIHFPSF